MTDSSSKKASVTGAGGFIASHSTETLARAGHQVRAMVHYNFQNNWGWLEILPADVMETVEVFSGISPTRLLFKRGSKPVNWYFI